MPSGPVRRAPPPSGGIATNPPELAATLAHELRTPLTAIVVGLHLLDERYAKVSRSRRQELVVSVRDETERLVRLVDDLVVLTRPRDDHRVQEPVSVQRLLPLIASREAAAYAPARVGVVVDPSTPPVRGDPDDISRIIDNLLAVSLAAGPRSKLVEVMVEPAGTGVRIRVTRDAHTAPATGPPAGVLAMAAARALATTMGGRVAPDRRHGGTVELVLDLPAVEADE